MLPLWKRATWCQSCREGNKKTLVLHTNGCPPLLLDMEYGEEE